LSLVLQDVLFDVTTAKPVKIDLAEIIKSRALFQANSGGGKSYILRKFLEKSHGKIQQIIIDPEGEFGTLREKYDYLLVSKGEGANIQLNINHAGLLARRLLETGANAILDLYELNPFERIAYVKAFCDALINLPKSLWHSCLIVIDEIHTFAPENSKGNAGSLEAVAALASRGRKRGYALIGATQKLSKFHKDVAAELNTKFTGRCILDIDQKRAAAELGLQDYKSLRNLKYEFWAFGPAISGEPILVKSYEVETKHEDIGNTRITTIADQDKLTKLMEQFKDLPTEAANELKTKEDLQKKIREQDQTIRTLNANLKHVELNTVDPKRIQEAETISFGKGFNVGFAECHKKWQQYANQLEKKYDELKQKMAKINAISIDAINIENGIQNLVRPDSSPNSPMEIKLPKETKLPPAPTVSTKSVVVTRPVTVGEPLTNNDILSPAETRVLIAIVQRPNHAGSRIQIGVMTEYTPSSGSFRNIIGKLRSSGFIQYSGDDLIATESGISAAGNYEPLPTDHSTILSNWCAKLPGPEKKILTAVCEVYPDTMTREELGEKIGQSSTSGSFRNSIGHLRSTGLIEYIDKSVKASKEMFPDAT